jgi:hypothetical protein
MKIEQHHDMRLHSNEMHLSNQQRQLSWNGQQQCIDHRVPSYSQSFSPTIRFEKSHSACQLVTIAATDNFRHMDRYMTAIFWNMLSTQVRKNGSKGGYYQDDGQMNRNLSQIIQITLKKIGSFRGREFSLTIHGIAKISSSLQEDVRRNGNLVEAALYELLIDKTVHHELFGKIATHIIQLPSLSDFSSQSIANIVWGFAKAGIAHKALFGKIADHFVQLQSYNGFKAGEICNIVWAFAKVGIDHFQLLTRLHVSFLASAAPKEEIVVCIEIMYCSN